MSNNANLPTRATVLLGALALTLSASILLNQPAAAQPPTEITFYVSPHGSDAWSGIRADPDRAKADGPFATVARAQIAVRNALVVLPGAKSITILLRGGFYAIPAQLQFDARDSGTAATMVRWAAYQNETPVLSGGVRLTGWKRIGPDRWEIMLPEVASGAWRFSQLYVDGERRLWPRLPEEGYYHIAGVVDPTPKAAGLGADGFRYRAGDIDPA